MKQGILFSLLAFIFIMILLKGKQLPNDHQSFTCEQLIKGYLKTEQIDDYYLANKVVTHLPNENQYIYYYRIMAAYKLRQSDVKQFQCSKSNLSNHYELSDLTNGKSLKLLLQTDVILNH